MVLRWPERNRIMDCLADLAVGHSHLHTEFSKLAGPRRLPLRAAARRPALDLAAATSDAHRLPFLLLPCRLKVRNFSALRETVKQLDVDRETCIWNAATRRNRIETPGGEPVLAARSSWHSQTVGTGPSHYLPDQRQLSASCPIDFLK
jgi:hypothetical protein